MAEVVFINCFEVPAGREDAFLELWRQIDRYIVQRPGFRSQRLHRSLDSDSRLRFVNVASWDSAEQFDAAHDENFRQLRSQPGWREFTSIPALYGVESERHG